MPISYTVATETVGELTGFELTGYYRERLGPTTVIHCWAERSASQMKIVRNGAAQWVLVTQMCKLLLIPVRVTLKVECTEKIVMSKM